MSLFSFLCNALQIETEKLLAYLVEVEINKRQVWSPDSQPLLALKIIHFCLNVYSYYLVAPFDRKKAHTRERNSMPFATFLVIKLEDRFHQSLTATMHMYVDFLHLIIC